ncbi:MAG: ABC transporter permease subunit [Polyangiaceae bacterium]|nr:ABC transporter permease subunit [Myxococcales bacterium]MCB9585538.1 ABC transporter permease subunit [Polyangiaceae bacterium]MCB9606446.1 ABC transporter permease subunit [Polyangiaceae bacterium]
MSAVVDSREKPSALESVLSHLAILIGVAFALYPLLWVVSLAFRAGTAPVRQVVPLPIPFTLEHLTHVVSAPHFGQQVANSLVVSLATALVGVGIALPAAYAMSRFQFAGKQAGTRLLLATQMFPMVASAVPLYLLLQHLGLLNTKTGLVLSYATTSVPFAIFQLKGAFDAIPKDLEEAAMVDGATRFGAFWRVVLPAARPAIAVTALFAFMSAYNEFVLAVTILDKEAAFTLPVVLKRYVGEHDADWASFAAGSLVVSLPVMALFYVAQRHLVSGLTAGGVKG